MNLRNIMDYSSRKNYIMDYEKNCTPGARNRTTLLTKKYKPWLSSSDKKYRDFTRKDIKNMTYIDLKNFDLQIENPIDKTILELLLGNLQYRYDNPKLKDHPWITDTDGFFIQLERRTNTNGKYVGIYVWNYPNHFSKLPLIGAMVKVYEKEKKIRVIAEEYMNNMDFELKKAMLVLLDHKGFYKKYS